MKKIKLFVYFIFLFILNFSAFAIIGGEDALPGEFAWHSKISSDAKGLCGGSLIDKQWVLTAAHCLVSNNGNLSKIENISVSFPNNIAGNSNYKVKK